MTTPLSSATTATDPSSDGVARWEQKTLAPFVAKNPETRSFDTTSGIHIKNLYTPADRAGADFGAEVGYPGEYPFTRGIYPNMYRGRFWTMRQYAGYATAEESNQRYHYLLGQGQTGLSVAFDLPTQIGYDPDHPFALGEVGKVGVSIASLEDMLTLFNGIPLDKVSTSMTINATASILLALYIAVGKTQGVASNQLKGTIQNDLLKEYIARGTYRFPPAPSMRIITDIFAFARDHVPHWNTISISGYHMREAGCTAVQEIAFTLANGIAYTQAAIERGLDIDKFAPQLSFFFVADNNFFEEVAKFRAARRLWARIMRERFGAKDPRSWMLRFHTQTSGASLTAQQPDNNVIRVTMQALAAVLGGTQSLHTNSKDEALALPTESAVQLALRTQQIIAYETGVTDTPDPLAGSYLVETLTDELEQRAAQYIEHIDKMGGALRAIEAGYIQREIQDSAYRYQQSIESSDRVIVGVNKFKTSQETHPDLLKVSAESQTRQIEKIQALRARRDAQRTQDALAALARAAGTDANLMPYLVDAVESWATIGEICATLEQVFGEYTPALVF